MIPVVLAIIAIVGVVGYLAYTDNVTNVVEGAGSAFQTITKGSPLEGFEIIHKIPKPPQQESVSVIQEVDKNNTDGVVNEDGDVVYGQPKEQPDYNFDDNYPTFNISNLPPIVGYIKLYDIDSKPIKPYVYDYMISVQCSDFGVFCNLKNTVNRGQTTNGGLDENNEELGGYYFYDWKKFQSDDTLIPANVNEVLYDITVFVDATDKNGKLKTQQSTYTIRLVP